MGLNHKVDHFDIPLHNRFQSLTYFPDSGESQSQVGGDTREVTSFKTVVGQKQISTCHHSVQEYVSAPDSGPMDLNHKYQSDTNAHAGFQSVLDGSGWCYRDECI